MQNQQALSAGASIDVTIVDIPEFEKQLNKTRHPDVKLQLLIQAAGALRLQNPKQACEFAQLARQAARTNPDVEKRAAALVCLARVLVLLNRDGEALECTEQARAEAGNNIDAQLLSELELAAGQACCNLQRLDKALKHLNDAAEHAADAGGPTTREQQVLAATARRHIGSCLTIRSHFDEALYYFFSAAEDLETLGEQREYAMCLLEIASVFAQVRNNDLADLYNDKALSIFTSCNCRRGICLTHARQGNLLITRNRGANATVNIDQLLQATTLLEGVIKYCETNDMTDARLASMTNRGVALALAGRTEEALTQLLEAAELARNGHVGRLVYICGSLAEIHELHGELDKALSYIDEAMGCAAELNSTLLQAKLLRNRSYVLERLGDNAAALQAARRADALREDVVSPRHIHALNARHFEQELEVAHRRCRSGMQRIKSLNSVKTKRLDMISLAEEREVKQRALLQALEDGIRRGLRNGGRSSKNVLRQLMQQIESGLEQLDPSTDGTTADTKDKQHFLVELTQICPTLSPAELRISLLLRLHLDTSAIAAALNISPRTVEAHRRSIRAKLQLPREASLTHCLTRIAVSSAD